MKPTESGLGQQPVYGESTDLVPPSEDRSLAGWPHP